MDKLEQYQNYIEDLLKEYSQFKPYYGDVEVQLVFDREHKHYQLMTFGWNGNKRIHGMMLHLNIKDGTERGIAGDLLELGVPYDDIVLAFQAPGRRKYTDFAVS
jgi:hypothetical protein